MFRPWAQALPSWIELCVVALPGRESRFLEPPMRRVAEVVDAVVPALLRLVDRPFALFGHSLGGLQAFEVARRLEQLGRGDVAALFVSGVEGPRVREPVALSTKPDAELIASLRELGGTPSEVLDNAELMSLVLPLLRADFAMSEGYAYEPPDRPPLARPIVALTGDRDDHVRRDAAAEWQRETSDRFALHVLEGDHFFVLSQAEHVREIVVSSLSSG